MLTAFAAPNVLMGLPSPASTTAMPAATLTATAADKEPAQSRSVNKGGAAESSAPVSGKKNRLGGFSSPSSAVPSVTHDPLVRVEFPKGGSPTGRTMKKAFIAELQPTAKHEIATDKWIKNDDGRRLSSQLPSQTCPPTFACALMENPRSQGPRESSSCVQGESSQGLGNAECLRPASGSKTNSGPAKSPLSSCATTSSETKESGCHDTALSCGALAELAALCGVDTTTAAMTSDSFETTYMDAFVASLPQPGASPANSPSQFSPAFCSYPSFAAYSASPYGVAEASQPPYGAVYQESLNNDRGTGMGNSSNTEDHRGNNSGRTADADTDHHINSGGCSSSTSNTALASDSSYTDSDKNDDKDVDNNSTECSSASFLPSLLPLLSHIKALSVSAGGSPTNSHNVANCAAAATFPPSQTPRIPHTGEEDSSSAAGLDSSGNVATQTQNGSHGPSPKRTSPYFPFFSFNSISSAFQSPAVSHLSRRSFCRMPLSPAVAVMSSADSDSAAVVDAYSTTTAPSVTSPLEAGVQRAQRAAGSISFAGGQGGRREGPAPARTKALTYEITKVKATGTADTRLVLRSGEAKDFAQPAPTTGKTQAPVSGERPGSAGKTDLISHRKGQKYLAATGAAAAGGVTAGAATANANAPPAVSSCAARVLRLNAHQAAEQKLALPDCNRRKPSINSSVVGGSPSYSSFASGANGTRNSKNFSRVLLHAKKSAEDEGTFPENLSTLQQLDWSGCFASEASRLQTETATTLPTGVCTFVVDEMNCMQTPSRTRLSSVRISPLLSQVYAASDNGVLCVWNMTGCCQRPLIINSYHSKAITELDISPDGQLLASASLDGTIRLKHTATATHVVHPSGVSATDPHQYTRPSSLFSSRPLHAGHLHSGSSPTICHHHSADYQGIATTSQLFDSFHLPAASPSAGTLPGVQMCTGLLGKTHSSTYSHGPVPPYPPCCYPQPSCIDSSYTRSVHSSNRLLLPASAARARDLQLPPPTVNLRRSASGEQQMQQHTVRGHSNAVVSVHFSSDGAFLLSASRDKSVKLWKNSSLDFLAAFTGHTNWVCCARFAPISASASVAFASCAEDRTVRVWNAERKVPVLLFRLCEGFQSTSAATVFGSLGRDNTSQNRSSSTVWGGGLVATSTTSTSSKFGPCLKSCRFVFGGASVLAGGSSDGTVTLWDVRQEPKAPSQYYNAAWLQSAPLFSTASQPGSTASSSFAAGCTSRSSSVICDTDRKGAVKKAGISYLDATVDGNSLLALSTSGVVHIIDLRFNKPLFSLGHTKTSALVHNSVAVARGKKTCLAHPSKQSSLHGGRSHHIESGYPLPSRAVATSQNGGTATAATSAENAALADTGAEAESAAVSPYQQQQQRRKRTAAVITAATFGPGLKKYEGIPYLQQHQQVLATADAEGRVVMWRWDLASPQMIYMQDYQATSNFWIHEKTADPFCSACSPYSADNYRSYFSQKAAEECMHSYTFAEEETRTTEADYMGGTPCMHTVENYGILKATGER